MPDPVERVRNTQVLSWGRWATLTLRCFRNFGPFLVVFSFLWIVSETAKKINIKISSPYFSCETLLFIKAFSKFAFLVCHYNYRVEKKIFLVQFASLALDNRLTVLLWGHLKPEGKNIRKSFFLLVSIKQSGRWEKRTRMKASDTFLDMHLFFPEGKFAPIRFGSHFSHACRPEGSRVINSEPFEHQARASLKQKPYEIKSHAGLSPCKKLHKSVQFYASVKLCNFTFAQLL